MVLNQAKLMEQYMKEETSGLKHTLSTQFSIPEMPLFSYLHQQWMTLKYLAQHNG